MRNNREKYCLYVGMVVAVLPVLLLRDFTPSNELRYLSIADEALRNHTLFAFTNHGVAYADKPPLYLWIIMLCRWLTGAHRMWLLSLFSLIPALGTVGVMDRWTRQEMDGGSRAIARLIMLTSGLFFVVAVTIRMDMLMCFFIVSAMHVFWKIITKTGNYRRSRWLFPLLLFLAVFTKGPLGLLIPLAGSLVYFIVDRQSGLSLRARMRLFASCWGWRTWSILVLLCSLWFAGVYAEGGTGYLDNLLFHQTIGRTVHSFRHNNPFYYYLIAVWYCLAPWSLLVIGTFVAALRPKTVKSSLQRFFLTVGLTTFVLLSSISSKLQIYLLPALPFIVYSAVMFLPRFVGSRWVRVAIAISSALLVFALPSLYVASEYCGIRCLSNGLIYASATILSLTGAYTLYILYGRRDDVSVAVRHIGVGILLAVFTAGWALPHLNNTIGYSRLCSKAVAESREYGITDIRTWRIPRADNMDVYLHRPVKVIPKDSVPPECGKPYLLLTTKAGWHGSKPVKTVGPYAVVCIEGKN